MVKRRKEVGRALAGLTVIKLSEETQIPESLLRMLARDTSVMYKPTRPQLKKGGSGTRDIDPPKKQYKRLMKRVAKNLNKHIKPHPAAHGGVTGRSSFTSARPLCGKKFIVTRDISECYPSVSTKKLYVSFLRLGATADFAKFLSKFMTVHGRIPQGGPLSSLALNLYMMRMDEHLHKRAKTKNGTYGRLTDDFVFATNRRNASLGYGKELDHAITHRGLKVNQKKREKKGFMAGDTIKVIHSLVVNSKRGPRPKDEHIQKGLELAKRYARRCRCATPNDLLYLSDLRARTTGMMYYMRQADFSPARHIRKMVEDADKKVLRMLNAKNLQAHKNKWWLLHQKRNEPRRLMRLWQEQK